MSAVNKTDHHGRKSIINIAAFCIASVFLNIIGSTVITLTGIPLYQDTAGTFLASICGGYLPGMIVSFITTIIRGLGDHEALYYNAVGLIMAMLAGWFARHKFFSSLPKTLLTFPAFALAAGIPDALLTWYLNTADVSDDYGTFESFLRNDLGLSALPSQFIMEIVTEFADKGLSLIIALIIVKLLPKRLIRDVNPDSYWQAPLSPAMKAQLRKSQCRSVSVRTKMIVILTAATILVAGTGTVISFVLYRRATTADREKLAQSVAELAASYIDPDSVDDYIEKGPDAPGYVHTKEMLYTLRDSSQDVEFVYVYKIEEDGCHVVFDLDTEEVKGSAAGDVIPFDESFSDLIPDLLAGRKIDPIITDDSFGWLLTVYVPVYNSDGQCVCYAAADISMNDITTYGYSFAAKLVSLLLGFYIFIIGFSRWLIKHNLLLPVNTMAYCAGAFAFNSDEALEESVERMEKLDIRTGDEIENLYKAFVKTIGDSMNYISDISQKNETISRMQTGLIMVLAEMVESRDKCTGDHVRKTAAYVNIIMESMREKGIYPDQVTDQFMQNVRNAAPLHDIGKIHVSDVILNKPARLTDEEFVIMKSHTTIGSEIIDRVIDLVQDSDYLREAKNLSEYHHEKWNGKGYPHGISGEEIPLSARIMAVADVFDALVSRRSYKEPFSFEEAMNIIRKDAGAHFDPLVVEAFISAEDKVREVAASFSDNSIRPDNIDSVAEK